MSESVRDYYNRNAFAEWERLDGALGRIEFASTVHLIDKYFPAQGRVCDIGGGPGRYTIELIRRGYQVTLLDLSEVEVDMAGARLRELGMSAERLIVGDARDLSSLASSSFHAALLMGPMYHVLDSEQRLAILRELHRVLMPRGTAVVSYLNSWGIVRTLIADAPHWYKDISVARSMQDENVYPDEKLTQFAEAYWSTPPAAQREIKLAGLELVGYAGAESIAAGMAPYLERMRAGLPDAYANAVQVAAETCELPQYRDCTDHLHFVIQKPGAV